MALIKTIKDIISIHAPLTGSDQKVHGVAADALISIHAPLTGSDFDSVTPFPPADYFNPRSPYGERHRGKWFPGNSDDFNPRSPYGERLWLRLLRQVR